MNEPGQMPEREQALFEAFVAGFSCSGEGLNAEYPFGDKGIVIAEDPRIVQYFQDWFEERTKQQ